MCNVKESKAKEGSLKMQDENGHQRVVVTPYDLPWLTPEIEFLLEDTLENHGVLDAKNFCREFWHFTRMGVSLSLSKPTSEKSPLYSSFPDSKFVIASDVAELGPEILIEAIFEIDEIARMQRWIVNGKKIKKNLKTGTELDVEEYFSGAMILIVPNAEEMLSEFKTPQAVMFFKEPFCGLDALCLKKSWVFAEKYLEIAQTIIEEENLSVSSLSEKRKWSLAKKTQKKTIAYFEKRPILKVTPETFKLSPDSLFPNESLPPLRQAFKFLYRYKEKTCTEPG